MTRVESKVKGVGQKAVNNRWAFERDFPKLGLFRRRGPLQHHVHRIIQHEDQLRGALAFVSGLWGGGVGYSWCPQGGTGQLRAGTYFGVVRVGVPGVLGQEGLLLPPSEFGCRAKKEEAVG